MSELFDTDAIGEGVLPTLKHALENLVEVHHQCSATFCLAESIDRQMDRQMNRQTDRWMDADRQTDRWTGRQVAGIGLYFKDQVMNR